MLGSVGEDHILAKEILTFKNGTLPAKAVGRLVEIIDDARVVLHFEGRGRVVVSRCDIRPRSFAVGERVRILGADKFNTEAVIDDIWTSASSVYMYRVMTKLGHKSYESHHLRKVETVGVPMVISELAKHMINVGSGCNPNTVPEWFQPVVNALKDLPQLSQMGQAQMEFVIKNHMTYRAIDNRRDLVTNVLFVIRACTSHRQLKTMEEKLYGYKEKLDTEWKKLNKIIPIEFQYAALMAYAETLND